MSGQPGQVGDLDIRIEQLHGGLQHALQGLLSVVHEAEQIIEFNARRDEMEGSPPDRVRRSDCGRGRADGVEQVSGQSNQAVSAQRSQIEHVATAMNHMSVTSQEVARSAAVAVSSAPSVSQGSVSGSAPVASQNGSIQRLSDEIDQSVAVINQLASDSTSIGLVLDDAQALLNALPYQHLTL